MRRVGTTRNCNFYFLAFPTFSNLFSLKMDIMVFLNFLNFFCYFLGIFYYASGRNEIERKFLFSPFLGLFQLTMAWNEAIMVFFNFLDFFPIFLQFSITRRVGTKRNNNFCFLSFLVFYNLFWLEMKPQPYFFNFFNFLEIGRASCRERVSYTV